ncbi:DUF805 domain-containing protein [Cellvibrio polysaccharolyticus]|uniref:DUF805 domain-containing protein n=1 Tax=Cellvibrio polysaccharolyticus TaxID=2082724 RepID=A0A928V9H0_9GAMM|nr:DUF805 domain-containing protein [Cellvibrio polysaccharolyticus]MBE8718959.1 DUF805 domain-containing protein [Cellvibrio polysaccharolyticus]
MEYFLSVVKQYVNFEGRARRREYWMYILFYLIFYVGAVIIDYVIGLGLIALIYSLALLLPSISVAARRLHDTGRSGWWQLLALIPLIGAIIVIIFLVQDSTPGDNKYGSNPKGING